MTVTDESLKKRLQHIWSGWGVQMSDHSSVEAQLKAVARIHGWLKEGASQPERIIRAVQCLLADPEKPGMSKRASWTYVSDEVAKHWVAVNTSPSSTMLMQAMLLAAWPEEQDGGLALAELLDSAWDIGGGRATQHDELKRWRASTRVTVSTDKPTAITQLDGRTVLTPFTGLGFPRDLQAHLTHLRQHVGSNLQYTQFAPQLASVLEAYKSALDAVGAALTQLPSEMTTLMEKQSSTVTACLESARADLVGASGKLDLLWWGQARYCRSLRKPYRRIDNHDDMLLWAALEAAGLSQTLEVEPAAAYLVETLHALGQDVGEKHTLLDWMKSLHASLRRHTDFPQVNERLANLTMQDALGLPVTWIVVQAAKGESLDTANDAVALNVGAEIDRGQWATWIFREILLDLRLGGNA